jgi:hypothetical protein
MGEVMTPRPASAGSMAWTVGPLGAPAQPAPGLQNSLFPLFALASSSIFNSVDKAGVSRALSWECLRT